MIKLRKLLGAPFMLIGSCCLHIAAPFYWLGLHIAGDDDAWEIRFCRSEDE